MANTTPTGNSITPQKKSAREKLEIELYRLETVIVEKLIPYGLQAELGERLFQFVDPPTEVYKYEFDQAQFMEIVQKVASDPDVSYDHKMAAGMGFVLQEVIWRDFHKDKLSWNLAWLVAALAGAYPPPPAAQRVSGPLLDEIESLLPDALRGKKVLDAAILGAIEMSAMAKERHKDWQDRADKLFLSNREPSLRAVAKRIERDLELTEGNSWEAIRKIIKRPK